jgi:hypothetical protein
VRHPPFRQLLVLTALACCLLAAAPAAGGAARPARVRVGTAPELPAEAETAGAVSPGRPLNLVVGLEPRDPAALAAFAEAVSTPGSPLFRQYLGVAEFAARFASPEAQIAAVRGSLEAQGLEVGPVAANHLTLPVSGTAAAVEAAFATPLGRVLLPATASEPERVAYANRQAPAVVAAVAPDVEGVVGLDDLTRFESQAEAHPPTGGAMPCKGIAEVHEHDGGEGWSADRIATAYGLPSLYRGGDLGAGQTVGLLELEPYSTPDIANYQACYGTATEVANVDVGGGPKPNGGKDGEAALDIEQVIGLAPAARVLVYQAPREGAGDLEALTAMVSQNVAKSLSTSWGACEEANPAALYSIENTLLQEAAAQGQSFFAAAGDDGSEDCIRMTKSTAPAVDDPASQPFATGVGGTTLTTAEFPPTESIWNEGANRGGTGGGVSAIWPMPAYQSGAAAGLGVVNPLSSGAPCAGTLCREVPDVSADAAVRSGYFVYAEGKWQLIGGTSAAAPLWASFAALADATPGCAARPIGFVNPAVYQLGGSAYAANFNDVTQPSPAGLGSNDVHFNGTRPFPVGAGYDMTTGVGTPIGGALATSLCGLAALSVGVAAPGSQSSLVGTAVALQIAAHQSAALPLTYSAAGLPAGLAIDPKTGAITGTPTAAGASTVTVTVTDQFGDVASAQFSWSVAATRVLNARLTGLAKRRPKLIFSIAALPGAGLRSLLVQLPKGLEPNRSSRALAKSVKVKGVSGRRMGAKSSPGLHALKIRLERPVNSATVKAVFPALIADVELVKTARRHQLKALPLTVQVTEAPKRTSSLSLTLAPR